MGASPSAYTGRTDFSVQNSRFIPDIFKNLSHFRSSATKSGEIFKIFNKIGRNRIKQHLGLIVAEISIKGVKKSYIIYRGEPYRE